MIGFEVQPKTIKNIVLDDSFWFNQKLSSKNIVFR